MQSEGACEVSCVGVGVELGFGLVFFTCCLLSVECVVVFGAYYIVCGFLSVVSLSLLPCTDLKSNGTKDLVREKKYVNSCGVCSLQISIEE